MTSNIRLLAFSFFFLTLTSPVHALDFELRVDRLASALSIMTEGDRGAVDHALQLIQKGDHSLALVRLSSLNKTNPKNSSLRILTAYALLQAGNLLGAFEEAKKAHAAPDGNSYKCWFLAKVALLSGNKAVCRKELEHVRKAGDMTAEVRKLENELTRN
jgi:Flp pilus assembly protein TadD